jgi:circadian clock protein KaiC
MGASGIGKTLLGLQFLSAGAQRGEKSVYLGFYESPQRLIGKAESVSIPLQAACDDGRLTVQWQPAIELAIDELAATALATVKRTGATRLVLDGIDGFRDSAMRTGRFGLFLNALTHQLRAAGVTTLLTEEVPFNSDPAVMRGMRLSAMTENLILLRYAETDTGLHRMISVVKQRESAHDSSLRELVITGKGLDVVDAFPGAASLLGGRGAAAGIVGRLDS